MANCPKCKHRVLLPTVLTAGLSARGCKGCRGAMVDLVAYRAWSDHQGIDAVRTEGGADIAVDDTAKAVLCPNCDKLMLKFRVSPDTENRLDYCAGCDAAWLDGGEWQQLEHMGLRANLGSVFSEPWQRRVREGEVSRMQAATLRERFGERHDYLIAFKRWLQTQPDRHEIVGWLATPDDG
ncbi:MAG: zf-TFIIB domain-containing protein [Pseudomonadota bacterium]